MSKIITDAFTVQGKSPLHSEVGCQDYARSFTKDGLHFAAVSDGCSSAPNSDFGARLMVLSAGMSSDWFPQAFERSEVTSDQLAAEFETLVINQLNNFAIATRHGHFLGAECFDATLVIAVAYGNTAFAASFGDGFIGVKYKDGSFDLHQREYIAKDQGRQYSTPDYLSYRMRGQRERWEAFVNLKATAQTTQYSLRDGIWQPKGYFESTPQNGPLCFKFDFSKIESIIVSSDGIRSFGQSDEEFLKHIVEPLFLSPATLVGKVITRKLNFNSSRTWPKNNLVHQDDLGMAGILKQG